MSSKSTKRDISNSGLLNALHEAAQDVSFFNAGEGPSYYAETNGRHAAISRWEALLEEAKFRGLYNPSDFKDYLL